MTRFPSTILPVKNDPKDNQRAILDLLDKLNQVADTSGGSASSVVSIEGKTSYQVPANTARVLLVKTGALDTTVYLPESRMCAGRDLEIYKIDSGAGTVIIVPAPGSTDTIDGVAALTLYSQYNRASLFSASTWWAIRDCKIQGSNANGAFEFFADGTLKQWGIVSGSAAINVALMGGFRSAGGGVGTVTMPIPFLDSDYTFTPASTNSAFGCVAASKTATTCDVLWTAVTSQVAASRAANWIAIGRWK